MRNGKIALLPNKIREQLNQRLRDGEDGPALLTWLNSLPEVKSVLAKHFDSRPVNKVNLCEWRSGGYSDWIARQDALAFVQQTEDKHALGHESLECMAARLVHWVALQYAASARLRILAEQDPELKWERLRQLCSDAIRLRRAELAAERVQLSRDRLEAEDMARDLDQKDKSIQRKMDIGLMEAVFAAKSKVASSNTAQELEPQAHAPNQPQNDDLPG